MKKRTAVTSTRGAARELPYPKAALVARFADRGFKKSIFEAQHPNLKTSTTRTKPLSLPVPLQNSIVTAISALGSGLRINDDHVTSLQTLSLWIRLQDEAFVGWEILTDVHTVLSDTGAPVIPFLNPYFSSKLTVEHQFPEGHHSSQLGACIVKWKRTTFDPQTQGGKLFLKHKLETLEEGAAEVAESTRHTTAIAGTILEDLDHALLSEHDYVIGASDGRLLARQDTQIDHVEAFATIKKRVASFLMFINDTEPTLAPIVKKLYSDFFIPVDEEGVTLIGTKYLFVSLYNCVDNLWLMEHRDNLEKSDQNTQEWLAGQTFFRGLSRFVQTESVAKTSAPLSQLIDETSFLDTFRAREDIKPPRSSSKCNTWDF
jgi:hypothetical protein